MGNNTQKEFEENAIELYMEGGLVRLALTIETLIDYKFPQYSHLITASYDGKDITLTFLDETATYKQEVADYVKKEIDKTL